MAGSNPYEQNAREKKAQAIVGLVWAAWTAEDRRSHALVHAVEQLEEAGRIRLAAAAGQKRPSAETWERVVQLLAERVQQEVGMTCEDATDTCACPVCDERGVAESGGDPDCPLRACYRGRISGYRDTANDSAMPEWVPAYVEVPCNPGQRAAVDGWLAVQAVGQ